jgi:hypothetical protein
VVWAVGLVNEGEPPAPTGFAELMDRLFDGLVDPQRRFLIEHDDRGHGTPSLAPERSSLLSVLRNRRETRRNERCGYPLARALLRPPGLILNWVKC